MPSYDPAPSDVADLIADVIANEPHQTDLQEAGIKVGALMATAKRRGAFAVKLHGWPCLAVVKINSEKDRTEGKPDATITIDAEAWKRATQDERRALIDHELYHLTVKRKDDQFVTDDCGRPKLKMRLHDWELGGFAQIADRYGEAAAEVRAARSMANRYGQLLFDWGDERPGRAGKSTVASVRVHSPAV